MVEARKTWALFRRRECSVPTWRGCLIFFAVFACFAIVGGRQLHSFLAVNAPIRGGVLVVEGWLPDYALQAAQAEFRRYHYDAVYVTGGPLQWGAPLSEYKTYAELGTAVLLKSGLTTNEVQAVPAPEVRQDRTYTAAVALREWAQQKGIKLTKVHLISEGPHARRSRLLFQKALGSQTQVGVTAIPIHDYDEKHWWRSSAGVRGVIGELLAYAYARLIFNPK